MVPITDIDDHFTTLRLRRERRLTARHLNNGSSTRTPSAFFRRSAYGSLNANAAHGVASIAWGRRRPRQFARSCTGSRSCRVVRPTAQAFFV